MILERTRDVKDSVRKLVLETIAEKAHVKAMTIAQRIKLLQDGLSDRSGWFGGPRKGPHYINLIIDILKILICSWFCAQYIWTLL